MSIWSERKRLISFQILPFIFLLLMVINFFKISKDQANNKQYALLANDIYFLTEKIPSTVSTAVQKNEEADYQKLSNLYSEISQKLNVISENSQRKLLFTSFLRRKQKEIVGQFSEKWEASKSILVMINKNRGNAVAAIKMKGQLNVVFNEINKEFLNLIKLIEDKTNNFSSIIEILNQIDQTKELALKFESALDVKAVDVSYKGTPYDNIEEYFRRFEEIRRNNQRASLLLSFEEIAKKLNFIKENQSNILTLTRWMKNLKEMEKTINQQVVLLLTLSTSIADSYYYLGNTWIDSASTYVLAFLILSSVLLLLYVLHQRRLKQLNSIKDTETSHVLSYINSLTSSLEEVCQHALESASIASESVVIANEGGKALRDTIHGMEDVQEEIQGTSNSILLLNKGSQEIEDIVSLIDAIADQTNILSLNASIQAAMAGEAGRGFGVVADEVQRLAIKASYATRQIASLVKNIQTNTTNVMSAMQQTKSDVLRGTTLVKDAGLALEKIQNIARHLSSSIENISVLIQEQTERSKKLISS